MPLAAAADALIAVCRGDMGSVTHMTERLEQLVTAIAERNRRPPLVLPIVIADRRHGARLAGHVAEVLSETAVGPALRGVGWLAWDPSAVQNLQEGGDPWAKPLRKSHLMQSARKVMWLLGMAAGIDHAEPETGKGAKGSRKQSKAETATPQQAPVQAQPVSAWGQQPAQGPASGWPPPPADGQHSNGQSTNLRSPEPGGRSLEQSQSRWQTAPMGEEI